VPYLIVVLATLTRFIPPPWSFSPVYGALLFEGANLKKLDSIWFSTITPGISGVVLTKFSYHLHLGRDELFQTAAFASIARIGWILQSRSSIGRLTFACLAVLTSFYLISDFGVRLGFNTYPHAWNGASSMRRGRDSLSRSHNRKHCSVRRNSLWYEAVPCCSSLAEEALTNCERADRKNLGRTK